MTSHTNFLANAPFLVEDDFEFQLDEEDLEDIRNFETAWREFLQMNPDVLPTGKKGKRIETIEMKLESLKLAKQNVEGELQRQLEFFEKSKVQLESNFEKATAAATNTQKETKQIWEDKLDKVGLASHLVSVNGPWELFLDGLDKAVAEVGEAEEVPETSTLSVATKGSGKKMKPSARAMYLANEDLENYEGRSTDLLKRAYQIDQALLKAQVKVLQREVQKAESAADPMETMGKFLTEHNIWGLLTRPGGSIGSGSANKSRTSGINSQVRPLTASPLSP